MCQWYVHMFRGQQIARQMKESLGKYSIRSFYIREAAILHWNEALPRACRVCAE